MNYNINCLVSCLVICTFSILLLSGNAKTLNSVGHFERGKSKEENDSDDKDDDNQ